MHNELVGAGFAFHGLLAAATTTTTKAKASSSETGIFILILIAAGAYMLFIRPQRAKLRAQQQQGAAAINPGDEVITNSGIIGRVLRFEGDRVVVEIAPGTNVSIFRTALGRRIEPRDSDEYYPPPADPFVTDEDKPAEGHPEEGDAHPDGKDGPWWPGPTGDASPSSGGST